MDTGTKSDVRLADAASIIEAAHVLRSGGLVAFPTETVYGLGADATNGPAVAGIFAAKKRPKFNPLIVHVSDLTHARVYAVFNDKALELAEVFWPGALTLVLPRKEKCALSELVSAGLGTVALRVPSHPVAARLLAESRVPLAAPSANESGRISATTAEHVRRSLNGKVDLILDGGATPLGLESTVIGFEYGAPVILRTGAIPRSDIETISGPLSLPTSLKLQAPGQLASHYAPRAPLRMDATSVTDSEVLLAFGLNGPTGAHLTLNLSKTSDLKEAAANLFSMLNALDATGRPIAAMPIPSQGLGEAINDRLRRAAAPRDVS
jgi:L-threonylcarbamoyladenylate synthase